MSLRFLAVTLAALVALTPPVAGQTADVIKDGGGLVPPGPRFVEKSFENADGTKSPYVVCLPGFDPKTGLDLAGDKAKPLPVILFLHGSGESKGGGKMPVEQGFCNGHVQKQAKRFPAIVVVPQCETRRTGWGAKSPDGLRAIAMLDATIKEYKCDEGRQYLTGLSMGGYGAWSIAAAYPERWAAVVPVCGGGDPADAPKIKDLPIWVFHGDADAAVKVERSRDMVAALKAAGGKPRYTEMAHVGHNSWDAAYSVDELYSWMFAQKKK